MIKSSLLRYLRNIHILISGLGFFLPAVLITGIYIYICLYMYVYIYKVVISVCLFVYTVLYDDHYYPFEISKSLRNLNI